MKKLLLFGSLFLWVAFAIGQHTVTGTIVDQNGEPLIGASVLVQGTTIGSISDFDGKFTLRIPEGAETIIVSYTGFRTREFSVQGVTTMNISMEEDVALLTEALVVGYGTQIKSMVTGNVARVKGEDLELTPVTTIEQALQGKSAGVYIESINGKPGGQVRVRIRGSSSISASNQPLFVIDGMPITIESQNTSGAALNPLADLNFNDIASVEILKDASAAAIYGSRAANGVVLITTKKGVQGETKVDFNYQLGITNPTGERGFLNSAEYIELFTEAAVNLDEIEGNTPDGFNWKDWVEDRFDRYSGPSDWRSLQTNTNWEDLAFQDDAISQQANLNFSGGNERTRFYTGLGYSDQAGVLIGNGFERLSGRLNLDHTASEKLNIGLNMSLSRTFTEQVSNDNAFSTPLQLIAQAPITPPRNPGNTPFQSGSQLIQPGQLLDRPTAVYYNGLIENEDAERNITSFRTLANGYLKYTVVPGLILNGELAVDIYNLRDDSFWGSRTFSGQATNGFGLSRSTQVQNYNAKAYASYDRSIGPHNVSAVAGIVYQNSRNELTESQGQEFPVDDLKTLASAADVTVGTSSLTEFSFVSYFARANYNYNRRYLVSVSGRADGSSRFGANNRYGFFPAFSAGWVLSEEPFLQGNSTFSFLKVRASWGQTGNASIGNFNHLGLFGAEGYNNTSGLQPSQIPNPDLTWETTTQIDFGLDFGIFQDRINGEIDFYFKRTDDLLLDVPVPATSGFSIQTQNIGEVENTGVEFVLNTVNTTGDFYWKTYFNVAWNKNEVTKLAESQEVIDPGSSRLMHVVKIGAPIGAFFGAEYAGVDPNNGDALWYLNEPGSERQLTNEFSDAEFVILGNPNPDVIGGITNSIEWRGFDLNVTVQGVFGNEIHNVAGGFMSCQACWFDNQTKDQLDRWQQPGDVTDVPKAIFLGGNGDQVRSSRYLSDGSYVRLKNVTLGYEFPGSILSNIGLRRLRVYVVGQNLATFTNYDGWDPEVSTDAWVSNINFGGDFYAAPQPKTIAFGINIGF